MHTTTSPVAVHLQETLGQVFGLFSKMIARRQATDPQAMSRTDYALLGSLAHCPTEAGIRISKLAEALGHDLSTISRRVTHLGRTTCSSDCPTRATAGPRPSA